MSIDGFEYYPRPISAMYNEKLFRGHHRDCLALLPHSSSMAVARVAKRVFLPSTPSGRERWLRDDLAATTVATIPLPPEIRMDIVQYLVHQYAVISMSSLRIERPGAVTIDLSMPFTLRYSSFREILSLRYLKPGSHRLAS